MRLLTFLEYAAIVVGAIAIFADQHFALAKGVHLGILLIGAGIAAGGIDGRRFCCARRASSSRWWR